ncbi:MAG: HAMP domain-containing protein [Deltaproteobacteria bacterium]|nr:HAMP domain-containing protein [Deltaproteobacteria bacterium]
MSGDRIYFSKPRVDRLLYSIERMAGGELQHQIEISPKRDELDAVAHAVNVMARELLYRLSELEKIQASVVQSGKLAALGEVSSGLAHELNNPLTVITGYVEHLRTMVQERARAPVDFEALETGFEKIGRNVDRMNAIIGHIMEFARQSNLTRRPLLLNGVIEKSFILIGEQLRLKNIQLKPQLSDATLMALGDGLRLEQVILNLLTNARDAIFEAHGDKGGKIDVRSRILSDTQLEIEIEDNGNGMTPEVRERIFNPFFTTKDVGQGTGLGLSISLGIIQDHGGSIGCETERGKGSRFTILLPRFLS